MAANPDFVTLETKILWKPYRLGTTGPEDFCFFHKFLELSYISKTYIWPWIAAIGEAPQDTLACDKIPVAITPILPIEKGRPTSYPH
jgi:hypothetical protein